MATNISEKKSYLGALWFLNEQYSLTQRPLDAYEVYCKALLACANGDGTLTDEERDWVLGLADACGCGSEIVEKLKVYEADEDIEALVSRSHTSNESRRWVIYDAIKACSADKEYGEQERNVVLKGAKKLGISEDVVKQIEELCLEEAKIRQKRIALMYPNGSPL
ncbi:hypothetical protein SD81_030215 [Tolypothrix campylonemoides VB511288]|nr:hypothetical protein SD81_030215 [Tolypothrix campylonemoides VB511288]